MGLTGYIQVYCFHPKKDSLLQKYIQESISCKAGNAPGLEITIIQENKTLVPSFSQESNIRELDKICLSVEDELLDENKFPRLVQMEENWLIYINGFHQVNELIY